MKPISIQIDLTAISILLDSLSGVILYPIECPLTFFWKWQWIDRNCQLLWVYQTMVQNFVCLAVPATAKTEEETMEILCKIVNARVISKKYSTLA